MSSQPPSSSYWLFHSEKQQSGPHTREQIVQWLNAGHISENALVSNGGAYIRAAELRTQASPPPLPAPPPLPPLPDSTVLGGPLPSASFDIPTTAPEAQSKSGDREEEFAIPERDRIVVLGRRQSGKTIYLASIYAKLWRSLDGLTAKALSGESHKNLMKVEQTLKQGDWPAATLESSQIEFELEYHGKKRLMVTLDFAGELFAKAFVDEQDDFPGVKQLLNHIDSAAAVVMLVDPSVAAGLDHTAAVEDDFGLVQAIQRIRNWPGGEDVPVVLVLTKIDRHQALLDKFGGPQGFVRNYFPALVRLLKKVNIFQVSAVQTEVMPTGQLRPRLDSQPINIDQPLRFCLRQIEKREEQFDLDRLESERRSMEMRLEQAELAREKRQMKLLYLVVSIVVIAGGAIAFVIIRSKV